MNIKGKVPLKPGQEIQFIGFVKSFLRSLNGVLRQQKPSKVLKHFYWERLSKSERRQLAALLATLDDSLDSHWARIHKGQQTRPKPSQTTRSGKQPPTSETGVSAAKVSEYKEIGTSPGHPEGSDHGSRETASGRILDRLSRLNEQVSQ